ncbi:exopolygalacturonase-like [Senna tora]|uniref:Exopolygalacturonase-like n=1 Tax=Senna tora TaxID=362788 RepID=A0A834TNX9_9FABA|nr:exopolygalacturonase-like [Senna tora]
MVNPVIFEGPCIGCMDFQIKGVLKASTDPSFIFVENWINFRYVHNLAIFGGGQLDGQGQVAWPYNGCHKNPNCRLLSTSMRFDFITNGIVHDIKSINSKSGHFILFGCENINMTKVKISAPSDSPNTDGIKISNSYGIRIRNVNIGTGDDCIAMISGTRKVRISRVTCGPGHGISVGSLGKDDGEEDVEDIVVRNCTFYGTSDGLRIKTWAAPLSKPLKASNLVYDDVVFYNVGNPIIIDQQYCPHPPCMGQVS